MIDPIVYQAPNIAASRAPTRRWPWRGRRWAKPAKRT